MFTGNYTQSAVALAAACHHTQVQINATIISLLQSGVSLAQISHWMQQNALRSSQFGLTTPIVPLAPAVTMNTLAAQANALRKLAIAKALKEYAPGQPFPSDISELSTQPLTKGNVEQPAFSTKPNTAFANNQATHPSTPITTRLKELVQESSKALGDNRGEACPTIDASNSDNSKNKAKKGRHQRPMKFMYCSPLPKPREGLPMSINRPACSNRPRKVGTASKARLFRVRFKNSNPYPMTVIKQQQQNGDKEAVA